MHRSPLIRIAAAFAALSVIITLIPTAPASAEMSLQAIPSFTFRGSGWGHGIGLSQYGAQGSAIAGKDYRWILAHYYTGTTIATVPSKTVRVNIDAAATPTNRGYTKKTWRLEAGQSGERLTVSGLPSMAGRYTFTGSGSNIVVKTPDGDEKPLTGTVEVGVSGGNPPLIRVVEGSGIYSTAGTRYRGKIELTASGGKIKAINVLPMDSYMYGVVPREMPSSWRAEALKAQAVAARSYAYTTSGDLYCTTRSQAYQGYGAAGSSVGETAATTAAVNDTKNQVLKSGSAVIHAYYSSQSGGHTANNEDVWVSGAPLTWARGVPDPYEHLAKPPRSPWRPSEEKTYSGLDLTAKLQGLSGVPSKSVFVTDISLERAASGHVRYATFIFSNGAKVRITGDAARSRLGLLSTRFHFNGFPMDRISGNTRYDTAVDVSKTIFPSTAPVAVIASGEDYADALTGSALAGAAKGALLLTASDSLPGATRTELHRLEPQTIYIMGGAKAVGTSVEGAVRSAFPSATVTRVQGSDRYQTAHEAAKIVASFDGAAEKVIVASGAGWADAASASALAYAKGYPILITRKDSLDKGAAEFLAAQKPSTTVLVGGTSVLSSVVQSKVGEITEGEVERDGGYDRYQTAALVAERCIAEGFVADELYVATGASYPDALTGGTLAGAKARPLLLTQTSTCPVNTAKFLTTHRGTVKKLWLLGGESAISSAGVIELDMVMMN